MASPKRWVGYAFFLITLGFVFFRAINQAIIHDEAVTYILFASPGPSILFSTFHSNNHTLHTFLVWLSTSIFGLSVLAIRLPALLGGVIYFINSERICNLAFKKTSTYLLALLVLTSSPFVLDYFNTARGYSLALGFWMWALFLVWKQTGATSQETSNHEVLISLLVALSVSANLTFSFINLALILAYTCLLLIKYYHKELSAGRLALKLCLLAIPGGILYLIITPSILFFSADTLYYGTGSWRVSLDSVMTTLLDQFIPVLAPVAWQSAIGETARWLVLGLTVLSLATTFFLLPRIIHSLRPGNAPEATDRLWILLILALVFTVGLLTAARYFAGTLLPRERTGIYLVPLLTLFVCVSITALEKTGLQKWINATGQLGLLALLVYYGLCLRLDPPREWTSYYRGDVTFQALLTAVEHYPNATIGVNWMLEPSFNFYARLDHADYLPRFTRRTDYENYRLLVLLPHEDERDRRYIAEHKVTTLYTNPNSGAVILLNRP